MGCLNGKLLANRSITNSADRHHSDNYFRNDDSVNSSSPDEHKLLHEPRLGNGTDKNDKKIRVPKIPGFKKFHKEKPTLSANDDSQPSTSANFKSAVNGGGGGVGLFGRRLCGSSGSKNLDLSESITTEQNGSILHSLGTLLENGGKLNSTSPRTQTSLQNRHHNESGLQSPVTPDRLHRNFQERLLTSQISRNNQRLTDSQLEFFRMLDEKIAQGREDDSWESSAHT